jgi:mono/diheme cytochrome c family protein
MKRVRAYRFSFLAIATMLLLPVVLAVNFRSDDPKGKSQTGSAENQKLIESLKGPELFRAHCAPCHGYDGKGNGPVASVLNTPVPDLTRIAKRNGGIFPESRVRSMILGDDVLKAHGSREMPIWGPIFHQVEEDRDYGNIRIKNLVEYVKSIQEK